MVSSNDQCLTCNTSSMGPTTSCVRIETLARICEATAWSQSPRDVYQKMVDALAAELGCDDASIYFLTVTGDYLTEHAAHGLWHRSTKQVRRISLSTGRIRQLVMNREPIFSDYTNPHYEDSIPANAVNLGFKCAVSIPLLAGDEVLGMICLSYKETQNWNNPDRDYLLAIGRLLGSMVYNMQQASNNYELELLIERKRLSSEIHDNISQLVSLLKMEAETALLSFEEDNLEGALKELNRLVATSQQTLKILREEILYLRAPVYESEGLVMGIEECLLRFSERWEVRVELRVEGIGQPIIVSTHAELQLTRIVHEALSNTLRHADASEVLVMLSGNEKKLIMQVSDNGCGFDPQKVPTERMGIKIMKERTDSIGGKLTIESNENRGTAIRVEMPRDPN